MTDSQVWGDARSPEALFEERARPARSAQKGRSRSSKTSKGRGSTRFAIAVGVLAVAALAALLIVRLEKTKTPAPTIVRAPAVATTAQGLQALATTLGHPLYWAGHKAGFTYELTQTTNGLVYVRYLPRGVAVGAAQPYLTIGTYPMANAYAVTLGVANHAGSVRIPSRAGSIAFYRRSRPTSVYLAFPGATDQIEVYDPAANQARQLVTSGAIDSVGGVFGTALAPNRTDAVATSPGALWRLSGSLGKPIYWIGTSPAMTYELTRTTDGRIYVRYLPKGVAIGTTHPYLTVATYPLVGALAATAKAATEAGAVKLTLPGGAIGFFRKDRPTNVYVAFPNVNAQVELFDPSGARAQSLVTSHKVRAVR